MLFTSKVPIELWTEAAKTVVYIMKRSPSTTNLGAAPD